MRSCKFCLVPKGVTPSTRRLYEAIITKCVPVTSPTSSCCASPNPHTHPHPCPGASLSSYQTSSCSPSRAPPTSPPPSRAVDPEARRHLALSGPYILDSEPQPSLNPHHNYPSSITQACFLLVLSSRLLCACPKHHSMSCRSSYALPPPGTNSPSPSPSRSPCPIEEMSKALLAHPAPNLYPRPRPPFIQLRVNEQGFARLPHGLPL